MCERVETSVAADEQTSLGFSAAQSLAVAGGEQTAELEWYEGGESTLTLELLIAGAPRLVETSYPEGFAEGDDEDLQCDQAYLEFEVALAVSTEDGQLDELVDANFPWRISTLEEVGAPIHFAGQVSVPQLVGTYVGESDALDFGVYLGGDQPSGFVVGFVDGGDGLGIELNVARFNEAGWPQTEG